MDTEGSRWMQVSGGLVFVAVLVLLSFVLPPLFGDGGDSSGAGEHRPPAGAPAGPPAAPPTGGHVPPAGAHGAGAGGGGR